RDRRGARHAARQHRPDPRPLPGQAARDAARRPRLEPGMSEPMDDPNGLLDPLDDAILGQLRDAFADVDPPPADLNERSRFAIRLENVDIEVSRLFEDTLQGAGARAADRIRTITFEAETMTIMVTVVDPGTGALRLEGWLAPAAPLRVELRAETSRA